MIVIEIIFWVAVFALLHSYVFYPIIIQFLAQKKQRPRFAVDDPELPKVHILMAAYNEQAVIEQKMDSIFASNYPKNKLKIWIGSDASSDKTDEIIEQFQNRGIDLHFERFSGRNGKPHIINTLAQKAATLPQDIFVITDANVLLLPNSIFEMVAYFKDSDMGLVGVRVNNTLQENNRVGQVESQYIGRENHIKLHESQANDAVIGVFGGCFALKSTYFLPTPKGFIADDFFTTMHVIQLGKKVIIAPDGFVEEDLPNSVNAEFNRKRRISAGNFQNMRYFWQLWLPPFNKIAFSFFSHKILRWLGPLFLSIIFIGSAYLSIRFQKILYIPIFILSIQVLFLVGLKKIAPHSPIFKIKTLNAICYFILMNIALLIGLLDFIKGIKTNAWERTQRN